MLPPASEGNWTASASDPPSLITSTEIWNVGPAGWLGGATRFAVVRCAGVTTAIEAVATAERTVPSTASRAVNGIESWSVPGASGWTCQTTTVDAPADRSTAPVGGERVAAGPVLVAGCAVSP